MSDPLDKTRASIKTCNFADIRHLLKEFHYKTDHIGSGISVCFAMFIDNELVGGSVLGKPRHEKKYKNCIDIRRMVCTDDSPKNSESWFLSQIIKWVTANTDYNYVLSYSDTTVGHKGTIYKATNFQYIGDTAPTKVIEWNGRTYHPRSLRNDRPYSRKMQEAVKDGTAVWHTGKPKKIWLYTIVRKRFSKKSMVLPVYKNVEVNKYASLFFS